MLVSPYKSRLVQVFGRILRRKRQERGETGASVRGLVDPATADSGFLDRHVMEDLPLVYLCQDQANPWFSATFKRQVALLQKTYDARVHAIEISKLADWPESMDECVRSFKSLGQVLELDRIFRDEEDLFGDRDDGRDSPTRS